MRLQAKIFFFSLSLLLGLATVYTMNRSEEPSNLSMIEAECLYVSYNSSAYMPQSQWGWYAANFCKEPHSFTFTIKNPKNKEITTQNTGCLLERTSVKMNISIPDDVTEVITRLC